jgi:hypothetical protein
MGPVLERLPFPFQVLLDNGPDRGGQRWLIVLDGNDEIPAPGRDVPGDVLLAPHRIERGHRLLQFQLLQRTVMAAISLDFIRCTIASRRGRYVLGLSQPH